MSDFIPGKTNICITSVSDGPSSNGRVRSKMRTVKIMRAVLAGIPILSPTFVTSCLNKEAFLKPANSHYVQCLPIKVTDSVQHDKFGVLKFGASHQKCPKKSQPLLFGSSSIYLCGQWKKSSGKTKDVQTLLKEGGAKILSNLEEAIFELQSLNGASMEKKCVRTAL